MKGLLIKDLLGLRKYLRTVLLMIAAYSVLIFFMDSAYFLSGMIVLLSAMVAITSFSFDHMAGWDVYALSLPVSRKDVVMSKYVLALILTLGGAVLSIAIGAAYTAITHTGSLVETLIVSGVLVCLGMLFVSILLPLLFKFGVEKARLMIIAVFAIPTAAFVALSNITGFKLPGEEAITRLLPLAPLVMIGLLAASYFISCAIYYNKEV